MVVVGAIVVVVDDGVPVDGSVTVVVGADVLIAVDGVPVVNGVPAVVGMLGG